MNAIRKRFPRLSIPLLVELAKLIVRERNAAAATNQLHRDCRLSLALLGCEVVRRALAKLDPSVGIGFYPGAGLSYVVTLGEGVPLRVQPDIPEIREVLPAEAAALGWGVQSQLFPDDQSTSSVLRLQVAQSAASPVASISLLLVDPVLGTTLDHVLVYNAADQSYLDMKSFELPPEDADTNEAFAFDEDSDAKKKDG